MSIRKLPGKIEYIDENKKSYEAVIQFSYMCTPQIQIDETLAISPSSGETFQLKS